jgi:hypothetical protein
VPGVASVSGMPVRRRLAVQLRQLAAHVWREKVVPRGCPLTPFDERWARNLQRPPGVQATKAAPQRS